MKKSQKQWAAICTRLNDYQRRRKSGKGRARLAGPARLKIQDYYDLDKFTHTL